MTEDEAKSWTLERYDSAFPALEQYVDLLIVANDRQNLIARSTMPHVWSRHIVDSLQLIELAPASWRHWVDVGSGAGLPGLVIAIASTKPVTLIEPRKLRVEFLQSCCTALRLERVVVQPSKAETAPVALHPADVISARAVAKADTVFQATRQLATPATTYILPKGETAKLEVAELRSTWQGAFHVEQSIVDPKSGIIVATAVARR